MRDLGLRVCGVVLRVEVDDARLLQDARRRYRAFVSSAAPGLRIAVETVPNRLRAFREEPRVVGDGRAWRIERHDLEIDLVPGVASARIVHGLPGLDAMLRLVLSFELVRRGGFLCHAAGVDGWLLPGKSGAGKSTLGAKVPKSRLLADELVGVASGRLWGTPFRGDFLPGFNPAIRPLRAILFLDRFAPRGVRSLGKAEALARLLRCVLFCGDEPRSSARILRAARACVTRAYTGVLSYDARTTPFRAVETLIREAIR